MAFPRKPSLLMKYMDEQGTLYQYTTRGWVVLNKTVVPTTSLKKKTRIKYNGSSRVRLTTTE